MTTNPFGNLSNEGLEESQDRLGGFSPLETDIYTGKIKFFYAGQSSGGAKSVTLSVETGGREYRETIYITNKQGENFFINKQSNKKSPLPGFTLADDICMVTVGKPLSQVAFEEKVLNIYDPEEKKELPKSVMVATELTGETISLAILKNLENKNEKDGNGAYVATADTRDTNNIDKVFHTESQRTVAEARNGIEQPEFWTKWLEKNKGVTRDKREVKDGVQSGKPGSAASAPQAGETAPRKSLFGK